MTTEAMMREPLDFRRTSATMCSSTRSRSHISTLNVHRPLASCERVDTLLRAGGGGVQHGGMAMRRISARKRPSSVAADNGRELDGLDVSLATSENRACRGCAEKGSNLQGILLPPAPQNSGSKAAHAAGDSPAFSTDVAHSGACCPLDESGDGAVDLSSATSERPLAGRASGHPATAPRGDGTQRMSVGLTIEGMPTPLEDE